MGASSWLHGSRSKGRSQDDVINGTRSRSQSVSAISFAVCLLRCNRLCNERSCCTRRRGTRDERLLPTLDKDKQPTMTASSSTPHHPFGFSQIPGNPSFRSYALNAVAVIPLLSSSSSSNHNNHKTASSPAESSTAPLQETHSEKSFRTLWNALSRHPTCAPLSEAISKTNDPEESLLLVVANSSLTRPGDWRYQETPLKAFHWQYGCQRLNLFPGRPTDACRMAHDRLLNPLLTRDWIDLCPSRRTAAVIGILNIHDCQSQEDLVRAQEELHQWATQRYATPPYQVTAHGQLGIERDQPVERLYVFDSFDEECQHIDLSKAASSSSILAFPPSDEAHLQMMDLHLNVVINDLAVAIFRTLEARIRHSDDLAKADVILASPNNSSGNNNPALQGGPARRAISRYMSSSSGTSSGELHKETDDRNAAEEPSAPNLSLQNVVGLVSPENMLAQDAANGGAAAEASGSSAHGPGQAADLLAHPKPSTAANIRRLNSNQTTPPQLLTPLDAYYEWNTPTLTAKDMDALKRRDMARREKLAADLSLLAGSPLDAYERYLKAAHLSRANPDPLWYAMSLVGCATAHIAMAEAGGYNVDEYLENNFSLPDDILAVAGLDVAASAAKQTFPEVVFALCEEALAILNRHASLACFYAGLLFQLALYTAESAESHLRCRWGEGPASFAGGESPPFRWENAITVKVSQLKTKDGRDMIDINIMNRTKSICELLQHAVSVPDLDPATRLDIATQSARLCIEGIPVRGWSWMGSLEKQHQKKNANFDPCLLLLCFACVCCFGQGTRWKKTNTERIQLPRKAAYFAVVAAEAMSHLGHSSSTSSNNNNLVLENLWLLACELYARKPNAIFGATPELGSYAWATLRASTLHALAMEGTSPTSLQASERLLTLLEHIRPSLPLSATNGTNNSNSTTANPVSNDADTPIKRTNPPSMDSDSAKDAVSSAAAVGGAETSSGGDETYTASVTKMIRDRYSQMTAGGSSLLAEQAKWANDNPRPAVLVPLSSSSSSSSTQLSRNLLALPSVWSSIEFDECSQAQRECMDRIKTLRKALSTSSSLSSHDPSVTNDHQAIPLSVSSKWSLLGHDQYDISTVKRKIAAPTNNDKEEDGGVMATFYNPFEKSGVERAILSVAAEEERVVALSLSNSLTVPLAVQECRLGFGGGNIHGRINSGPVSFVLAPLAQDFVVHFPFTIISPEQLSRNDEDSSNSALESIEFELQELSFSCLNHRFSLPIRSSSSSETRVGNQMVGDVAQPASYPFSQASKTKPNETIQFVPLLEALPCQPRLNLCHAATHNVLKPNGKLVLGVTEGELVSSPQFHLSNDSGAKGHGLLQRIQIVVSGANGILSEKIIYDSNEQATKLETEPLEREFLSSLESSQLLKVRVLPQTALELEALNAPTTDNTKDRTLGFQIAISKQFREKVNAAETELLFRIRYAGKSTKTKEIWRTFDVPVLLSHFPGPRVTAMTFRPDLAEHGIRPELLQSFETRARLHRNTIDPEYESNETTPSNRVGLDNSIHLCSQSVFVVASIQNDSHEDIVLSRSNSSPVGTFASSALSEVVVPKGVEVSIPMSIQRLPRVDTGDSGHFADEIFKATDLLWNTDKSSSSDPAVFACGSISMNRDEISKLIAGRPSYIPSVFEPPCTIGLEVQGTQVTKDTNTSSVSIGEPIAMVVNVSIAPWIPAEMREDCDFTVELFAVWLEKSTVTPAPNSHAWCGMVTRKYKLQDMKATHAAKVILLQRGGYALSACLRFSQFGKGDEVWWAPMAANISVDTASR